MKMTSRLLALVLAVVMCFGMLAGCDDKDKAPADGTDVTQAADGAGNEESKQDEGITLQGVEADPYGALLTGIENYIYALSEKCDSDAFAVFEEIAGGVGTYSASADIPDVGAVNVSAVVDASNLKYSLKAGADIQGESLEAFIWGDTSNIVVGAPAIIGETNYGVSFDTLLEDLETSELFASLTGGMTLDDIVSALEEKLGVEIGDLENIEDAIDTNAVLEKIETYFYDLESIVSEKEYKVAEEAYELDGKKIDAVSVEYTLTPDDFKKAIDLSVDFADGLIGNAYEKMTGVSLKEEIEYNLEDLDLEEIGTVAQKLYLNKKNGTVIAIVNDFGENGKAVIAYGENPAEKLNISGEIDFAMYGDENKLTFSIDEITDSGKEGLKVAMNGYTDGEEVGAMSIVLERDTESGNFTFKATLDEEEVASVAGNLKYSDKELSFGVDSITADGETIELGLVLSVKAGGTVEAVPEYTNILTASMTELTDLITVINGVLSSYYRDYDDYDNDYDYDYDEDYDYEYDHNYDDEYSDITIDDLLEGMTEEEIDDFYKELEDMGMTEQDYLDLING